MALRSCSFVTRSLNHRFSPLSRIVIELPVKFEHFAVTFSAKILYKPVDFTFCQSYPVVVCLIVSAVFVYTIITTRVNQYLF